MEGTTTITREKSVTNENVSLELNKVGVYAIATSSAMIGCWAVVCLASGTISSGGPAGLVSSLVSAFTG